MKTLQEIKEEYAQHNYGESWFSWTCGGSDISNSDLDAVAKRFAIEVAKEALSNASEVVNWKYNGGYDCKQAILSESNIPQL